MIFSYIFIKDGFAIESNELKNAVSTLIIKHLMYVYKQILGNTGECPDTYMNISDV